MASKRQLWADFWRDVQELQREFNGMPQPVFMDIFRKRGMLKRYSELSNIDSKMTTDILHGSRLGKERFAHPVEVLSTGNKLKWVWKLASVLNALEWKQVRKGYRRGSRDLAALSNKVTKLIAKRSGEHLNQIPLDLFDDDPKSLNP